MFYYSKMSRCTTRQFAGARIMAATKSGKGEGRPQREPPPPPPRTPNLRFCRQAKKGPIGPFWGPRRSLGSPGGPDVGPTGICLPSSLPFLVTAIICAPANYHVVHLVIFQPFTDEPSQFVCDARNRKGNENSQHIYGETFIFLMFCIINRVINIHLTMGLIAGDHNTLSHILITDVYLYSSIQASLLY